MGLMPSVALRHLIVAVAHGQPQKLVVLWRYIRQRNNPFVRHLFWDVSHPGVRGALRPSVIAAYWRYNARCLAQRAGFINKGIDLEQMLQDELRKQGPRRS